MSRLSKVAKKGRGHIQIGSGQGHGPGGAIGGGGGSSPGMGGRGESGSAGGGPGSGTGLHGGGPRPGAKGTPEGDLRARQAADNAARSGARASALAHPRKSLAKIAAGKTLGLDVLRNAKSARDRQGEAPAEAGSGAATLQRQWATPDKVAIAKSDKFVGHLQARVDRHDAIHARRAARNANPA